MKRLSSILMILLLAAGPVLAVAAPAPAETMACACACESHPCCAEMPDKGESAPKPAVPAASLEIKLSPAQWVAQKTHCSVVDALQAEHPIAFSPRLFSNEPLFLRHCSFLI